MFKFPILAKLNFDFLKNYFQKKFECSRTPDLLFKFPSIFLLTQETEARLAVGSFGNGWRQRRCHIGGSAVAAKGRGNPPDEEHAGEHAAAAQDPATVQVAGRNAAAARVFSGQRRRKQRRPSMRNIHSITN